MIVAKLGFYSQTAFGRQLFYIVVFSKQKIKIENLLRVYYNRNNTNLKE